MAILFISLLVISILGIVTLLAVKRWEISTGRMMLNGIRPATGRMLGRSLHFLERQVPAIAGAEARRGYAYARVVFQRLVAWVVVQTERGLERTLHTLRGATQERGDGEASAFLREVAQHKKSLIKRSGKKKNAIYEE